jgi:hypothetical protein
MPAVYTEETSSTLRYLQIHSHRVICPASSFHQLIHTQGQIFLCPSSTSLLSEYIEWQWPLSGVHSIMRVKSAQAGEGSGCKPFHYIYHHVQSCGVRSSWEGRCNPPISTLPLCVLCGCCSLYRPQTKRIYIKYPIRTIGITLLLTWLLNSVKQRSDWLLKKKSLFLDYKRWLFYEDPQ